MKALLKMSVLALVMIPIAGQAGLIQPGQTLVSCRDLSHLPSGLSLVIRQQSGKDFATLTNRDDIGPYENLGTIAVTRKPVPAGVMGAGVTYLGPNFNLNICTDCSPMQEGIYSHVYADIDGRVFNQPMVCNFLYN